MLSEVLDFIGFAVVAQIRSKGHEADVLDLKQENGIFPKDIRDKALLAVDLSRYAVVMIFAAVTSQIEFEKHPEDSFATNVDGLFNVLEACRRSKVKKVVFASSSAVYGNVRKSFDPLSPRNMYAASKLIGEILVNTYVAKGYFDGLILRYFNVYGIGENSKGAYRSIISIFLESIEKNGKVMIYGNGKQRRDFINVKDVARITFELAMNHSGTFNVGTGKSTSWNEILRHLKAEGLQFTESHIPNPIRDYQQFTEANVKKLHSLGLKAEIGIKEGIRELL